jgi:hypothetical protein
VATLTAQTAGRFAIVGRLGHIGVSREDGERVSRARGAAGAVPPV